MKNIDFEKLPKNPHIELRGDKNKCYVYVDSKGEEFVVIMTSRFQRFYQKELDDLVIKTKRREYRRGTH